MSRCLRSGFVRRTVHLVVLLSLLASFAPLPAQAVAAPPKRPTASALPPTSPSASSFLLPEDLTLPPDALAAAQPLHASALQPPEPPTPTEPPVTVPSTGGEVSGLGGRLRLRFPAEAAGRRALLMPRATCARLPTASPGRPSSSPTTPWTAC